jgi:hypothetical protein
MAKEILNQLQNTFSEIEELVSSLEEQKLNAIPFEGSWTAAQVTDHVTRSINGMNDALGMPGKVVERNPGEKANDLKTMFLNFENKMKSPAFILPTQDVYEKKRLVDNLKNSDKKFIDIGNTINFSELLNLAPLGEFTKLEVIHFVLYHTQRHIHQFKNIVEKVTPIN